MYRYINDNNFKEQDIGIENNLFHRKSKAFVASQTN